MLPVKVIELNLHKVPLILVVLGKQHIEDIHIAVIGKTEVTDAARLTFGQQEIKNAVVDVAAVECSVRILAHTHTVEKHIVDMVGAQLLQ